MSSFYVRREGQIEGPWELSKLQSEIRLRKLAKYHDVSEDKQTWIKAGSLEELFPKRSIRKQVGGRNEDLTLAPDELDLEEEKVWYFESETGQQGPMTLTELRKVVSSGNTVLDDLVWRDGWPDWRSVEQVPEIGDLLLHRAEQTVVTDATRMVDVPAPAQTKSTAAMISVSLGIIVLALSCLPPVGFLGIVPMICGVYALTEIKKKELEGSGLAYGGIALGLVASLVSLVSLIAGLTYLSSQS